jgi:hypothetical protein
MTNRQFIEYPIFRKPGYDWGLSFNNSRAYTAMLWDRGKGLICTNGLKDMKVNGVG